MHYQTRQLIATRDQRFGNQFLTKGDVFMASVTDAQHLLARGHAEEKEKKDDGAVPDGITLESVVLNTSVPGLDGLNSVFQQPVAKNDAQTSGNDGTAAVSESSGTDAAESGEKTAQPGESEDKKTEDASPSGSTSTAETGTTTTVAPRRTITRRSQAAA